MAFERRTLNIEVLSPTSLAEVLRGRKKVTLTSKGGRNPNMVMDLG
jgi:hypothetical protein